MDRTSLNLKIFGAVIAGVFFGTALVVLCPSYGLFLGPSEPPQEYPVLLIGVTGLAVAAVAYAIAKLHYRKQSWM
ncbi:MAG: hypothetical protein ACFFBJ_11685 [Promethearchaeota archaeon]